MFICISGVAGFYIIMQDRRYKKLYLRHLHYNR